MWKLSHESGLNIDTSELAAAPGGKAAVTVFRREWTNAAHEAVERAETAERNPETLVMVSDSALRLTRDEALQFSEELTGLVNTWRVRGHTSGPDARTYQVLQILQPAREA